MGAWFTAVIVVPAVLVVFALFLVMWHEQTSDQTARVAVMEEWTGWSPTPVSRPQKSAICKNLHPTPKSQAEHAVDRAIHIPALDRA